MPTGEYQIVPMVPTMINVSTPDGVFVNVTVQGDGNGIVTSDQIEATTQNLIDYLQLWPGRLPGADVTAQSYVTRLAMITPTDPEPLPDPPEDPPS